ncbi:MAG: cysteine desulfurase [Candidatus Woesearchaeota archaeon]
MMLGHNANKIRDDFPLLVKNPKLIYFDNACMSLKPKQVIDAQNDYYENYSGCVARTQHTIGKRVTEETLKAREEIAKFFSAKANDIIFTKNTTESINLIARSLEFKQGDVVLGTDKEHNSNLIPWLANKCVKHEYVESNFDNSFSLENFEKKIKGVKLVSMVHTSNLDGTTIPAKEVIKIAHDHGALVLLDCAQSAAHQEIDTKKLDVDFMACSGHKMLGPTGIGALYGKPELLEKLNPFMVGGETVTDSTYDSFKLEKIPQRFEAGLQHYAGMIGFGAAVKYLSALGMDKIHDHEIKLNTILTQELGYMVDIIGPKDPKERSGIFSFNVKCMDPHEVAIMLDTAYKIAVRSGNHCVHSWFNAHNMKGSARASLYLYNTSDECKVFVDAVKDIVKLKH